MRLRLAMEVAGGDAVEVAGGVGMVVTNTATTYTILRAITIFVFSLPLDKLRVLCCELRASASLKRQLFAVQSLYLVC